MTTLVVDASVVIKWVVQEEGSDAAVRLIGGPSLIAPDLLIPECVDGIAFWPLSGIVSWHR